MANSTMSTLLAPGAVDVSMLADGTDGELITWDAAGAAATVAVGTAGHVLTSNGAGAAPTFQTPITSTGFYAYLSTDQAISNSTVTVVSYNTEVFDVGSLYDNTSYQYTPDVAGKYIFAVAARWEAPVADKSMGVFLRKNGATIREAYISPGSTNIHTSVLTGIIDLNGSTDYVDVAVFHSQGLTKDVDGGGPGVSFFSGALLEAV